MEEQECNILEYSTSINDEETIDELSNSINRKYKYHPVIRWVLSRSISSTQGKVTKMAM